MADTMAATVERVLVLLEKIQAAQTQQYDELSGAIVKFQSFVQAMAIVQVQQVALLDSILKDVTLPDTGYVYFGAPVPK